MGKIRVGAAKMCINPPAEMFPLEDYKAEMQPKEKPTTGLHGYPSIPWKPVPYKTVGIFMDIYTRIVVIDDGKKKFLFLNLDSGPSLDDEFKNEIHETFGIPPENILGVWTHNHSTHIKWGRNPTNALQFDYYNQVVHPAVIGGIELAISRLQPAKFGFAEGDSYINVNRDVQFEDGHWMEGCNFRGPVDRTLAVMKFVDMEGKLIAAVTNYGCHPTSLRPEVPDVDGCYKVAPDFPGVSSEYVEKRFGNDCVCLWTNGSSGDTNPVCTMGYLRKYELDGYNEPIDPPFGFAYQNMMTLGCEHGIDTIRTLNSITEYEDSFEIRTEGDILNLPRHKYVGTNFALDWSITDNLCNRRYPELLVNGRTPPKETRGTMVYDPDGVSPLHMQVAVFGDVAWVGVSGEPYTEIGWRMKEESPFKKTVVISHCHGDAMFNGGYLLSNNAKDHDTFTFYSSTTHPDDLDGRISRHMNELFDKILYK